MDAFAWSLVTLRETPMSMSALLTPRPFKYHEVMLTKVIDEHDVAARITFLRIEDPAAIRRN